MSEEDEWKKLPTDQKVQHTLWKARAEGYKECIKVFPTYDEKSPEFSKYLGLVKKFVIDSNELNRIQGLQAALVYVGNAHCAGKTCSDVISGVLAKCLNSKPKLRELGIELCMMYIEVDKNEMVVEELLKGLTNKQPKIVHACLDAVIKALSEFGSKVVSVKPILKQSIKLLDHRDKNVREATKHLFVEIFKWIGAAIQTPLQGINPVVLKELEVEWEKLGSGGGAKQTRFMRSQQDLREKMEAKAAESEAAGDGLAEEEEAAIDPYDLLEPQEILSQLPKSFYEKIEEKKWQERKSVLEPCEKLTSFPRIAPGDYGDFVKALKKVVSKDTNVMLVTIAIKCVGGLANGLRKKFQPYALVCLDAMLEKFKEKKIAVVTALQEAVDAIYLSTTIQAISETCIEFLLSKNPSIRAQTGYFLARAFAKTKSAAMNKALMKLFIQPLLKNIDHSTPDVRDAAYQAIGTLSKVVGENKIQPFIADLDKLKLDKINECAGKAVVTGSKKSQNSAPVKKEPPPQKAGESKPPSTKSNKSSTKASSSAKPKTVKGGKKQPAAKPQGATIPTEAELGEEVVDELVSNVISSEEKSQITNMNWKERLAGLQSTFQKLKMLERGNIPCQAFVRFLSLKPGWKDNNFNCLNEKFKILEFLALNSNFTRTSANVCLAPTVDKVGDVKCGLTAKTALSSIAEATGFPWVADQVMESAMSQKNPKIQSESLQWLASNLKEFGLTGVNVKLVIDKVKVALSATNPAVRTAGLTVIGTLTLYIGEKVRMFFESEKPALLQQIDTEMEKVKGESPPVPTRGMKKSSSGADTAEASDEEAEEAFNINDMVTRIDISGKITDALVTKLSDKNWKERKEALETVTGILDEAKFVEPNIGDLPVALKARLVDSNKILLTTTLNILMQLAKSLGPHCSKHLQILLPNLINVLADSKPQVRQTGLKCMDEWLENTKISMWLEGDTISSALSVAKHIFLRIELFNWLADKLSVAKKLSPNAREGLEGCIPVLYSCCEDRSGEVRAKAQAFLPVMMKHLSYDKMLRGTGKLGTSSKSTIVTLLEKAREHLPPPTTQSNKKAPPSVEKQDVVVEVTEKEESKKTTSNRPQTSKEKRAGSKRPTASAKKSAPEEDSSPLFLPNQNGKEQRMKDEFKLKTVKWNFAVPREELVTQLHQQLTTCMSSAVLSEMFHADFQHHLKAITMITQGLSVQWEATVNCIDILLRWFTLRFYDKNTTVHIKSLEYLKMLFDKLIESSYKASDYEMASFLPHLMIKIGENKDNIRKAVHGILQQVSSVYPASKLFNFIMDGIKSKNSRQRSECLDHVALLIERHGLTVCQPSAQKALKEIATNISDRDKGVRSSALNTIVAAYNVSGDIVFKQVGKLNEKDMSMLEERVKRSGKYNENQPTQQPAKPTTTSSAAKSEREVKPQQSLSRQQNTQPAAQNSNSLHSLSELHSSCPSDPIDPMDVPEIAALMSQVKPVNIDHLLQPIPIPDCVKEFKAKMAIENAKTALDVIVSQLSSPQIDVSITAAHELYTIISHKEKWVVFEGRIDDLVTAMCTQLRMITDRYLPMIIEGNGDVNEISIESFFSLCKSQFSVLVSIFSAPMLASQATTYVMFDLLRTVVQLLINEQLNTMKEGSSTKLIQTINILIHRMLENCDPTAISCALIRVLHDSMEAASKAYVDVLVKCLWKFGRSVQGKDQETNNNAGDTFEQDPLNLAMLLSEIDRFWRDFPRNHPVYLRIQTDFPLRSVKTVIVIFCKQMGPKVADQLHMIPNPELSEVVATVQKNLKMTKTEVAQKISDSSERKENIASLSRRSLEAKLAQIFKKIGNYRQYKQGIYELYDFKQEYPGYDVDPHIETLEETCKNVVKNYLIKIESERTGVSPPLPPHIANIKTTSDYVTYLNGLRKKINLPPLCVDVIRSETNKENPQNEGSQAKILGTNTTANQAQNSNSSTAGDRSMTSSRLLDLKRRLDEIKQGMNKS